MSHARVEEAAGAAVVFAVICSRAASSTVTVDYATRDGDAPAGDDYTSASGTLMFWAGESTKTIEEVAVLDDAHDGGEKTFTIENTDLRPAALLAGFGRATAEQVVRHIEERTAARRSMLPGAVSGPGGAAGHPGGDLLLQLGVRDEA